MFLSFFVNRNVNYWSQEQYHHDKVLFFSIGETNLNYM